MTFPLSVGFVVCLWNSLSALCCPLWKLLCLLWICKKIFLFPVYASIYLSFDALSTHCPLVNHIREIMEQKSCSYVLFGADILSKIFAENPNQLTPFPSLIGPGYTYVALKIEVINATQKNKILNIFRVCMVLMSSLFSIILYKSPYRVFKSSLFLSLEFLIINICFSSLKSTWFLHANITFFKFWTI